MYYCLNSNQYLLYLHNIYALSTQYLRRSPYDLETVIILEGSEYYEFIHVEQYGYVKSYNPKTTSGDHHHLMFIRGEDEMEVHLPIKPKAPGEQVRYCQFFLSF